MTTKRVEKKADGAEVGQEPGFEQSLARLETIVSEMEHGSLSLEDMIRRFEEGQSLIKFCSLKLNEVERRIEILVKKGDDVIAEPFEEGAVMDEEDVKPARGERAPRSSDEGLPF